MIRCNSMDVSAKCLPTWVETRLEEDLKPEQTLITYETVAAARAFFQCLGDRSFCPNLFQEKLADRITQAVIDTTTKTGWVPYLYRVASSVKNLFLSLFRGHCEPVSSEYLLLRSLGSQQIVNLLEKIQKGRVAHQELSSIIKDIRETLSLPSQEREARGLTKKISEHLEVLSWLIGESAVLSDNLKLRAALASIRDPEFFIKKEGKGHDRFFSLVDEFDAEQTKLFLDGLIGGGYWHEELHTVIQRMWKRGGENKEIDKRLEILSWLARGDEADGFEASHIELLLDKLIWGGYLSKDLSVVVQKVREKGFKHAEINEKLAMLSWLIGESATLPDDLKLRGIFISMRNPEFFLKKGGEGHDRFYAALEGLDAELVELFLDELIWRGHPSKELSDVIQKVRERKFGNAGIDEKLAILAWLVGESNGLPDSLKLTAAFVSVRNPELFLKERWEGHDRFFALLDEFNAEQIDLFLDRLIWGGYGYAGFSSIVERVQKRGFEKKEIDEELAILSWFVGESDGLPDELKLTAALASVRNPEFFLKEGSEEYSRFFSLLDELDAEQTELLLDKLLGDQELGEALDAIIQKIRERNFEKKEVVERLEVLTRLKGEQELPDDIKLRAVRAYLKRPSECLTAGRGDWIRFYFLYESLDDEQKHAIWSGLICDFIRGKPVLDCSFIEDDFFTLKDSSSPLYNQVTFLRWCATQTRSSRQGLSLAQVGQIPDRFKMCALGEYLGNLDEIEYDKGEDSKIQFQSVFIERVRMLLNNDVQKTKFDLEWMIDGIIESILCKLKQTLKIAVLEDGNKTHKAIFLSSLALFLAEFDSDRGTIGKVSEIVQRRPDIRDILGIKA